MGQILSSTTVYSVAYLTETGRKYLFNESNNRFVTDPNTGLVTDLFQIQSFTLSDPDTNYESGILLQSGDIPDLSGSNAENIKGALDMTESSLVSFNGVMDGTNVTNTNFKYQYQTNAADNTLVINVNVSTLNVSVENNNTQLVS